MKRKSILSIVATLLSAVNLFAYDFKVGGIYYQINSDGTTVSVTNSGNTDKIVYRGDVVIPNSVTNDGKTYAVTEIASKAFYLSEKMKSLTIPESVTTINRNAFTRCKFNKLIIEDGTTTLNIHGALLSVGITDLYLGRNVNLASGSGNIFGLSISSAEIGKNVTYINNNLFYECPISSIILPESITEIDDYTFYSSKLQSIVIPNSVKRIGQYAFYNTSLTEIDIPESVSEIGYQAFAESDLVKAKINCDIIRKSFFTGCSQLSSVTIGKRVTEIEAGAFFDFPITELILEDGDTELEFADAAFNSESMSLYLGRHVINTQNLNYSGFDYEEGTCIWPGVTSVTTGKKITEISDHAFFGCKKLTLINISNQIKKIGEYAFYGCESAIIFNLPESLTEIGLSAFAKCSKLITVNMPGVKHIEEKAFKNCQALRYANNMPNVTHIGSEAFSDCKGLESVTIPEGVTGIEPYTFYNCTKLTSISIPKNVTEIGEYAFDDCSGLRNIQFSEGLTKIGDYAFYGCKGVDQTISIPKSVTEIGYAAFRECSYLRSIQLPVGLTKISGRTFMNCNKLSSISIPESVTEIESEAFSGCSNLTSVNIPEGISVIEPRTFSASGLTSIDIPKSVTEIGSTAFKNCYSLTSVNIPDGVSVIGSNAFENCTKLTSIVIPESVTSIGDKCFAHCDLKEIKVYAVTPPEITVDTFDYYYTVYVPKESFYAYKRHKEWRYFKIVGNLSSVSTTQITATNVFVKGGVLHIEGTDEDFRIYSSTGQLIYSGRESSLALPHGVYIIILGNETQKVIL